MVQASAARRVLSRSILATRPRLDFNAHKVVELVSITDVVFRVGRPVAQNLGRLAWLRLVLSFSRKVEKIMRQLTALTMLVNCLNSCELSILMESVGIAKRLLYLAAR